MATVRLGRNIDRRCPVTPVPYPVTGNRCRLSASAYWSSRPTQKAGMPSPNSGTARTMWSRMPLRRLAASMASGTLMAMASTAA